MEAKPKKCKGTGKAFGYGCGEKKLLHKFGICRACFAEWLYNTDSGKIFLDSTQIRAKKHVQKEKKKDQAQKKEENRSKSYFEKQLEHEVNAIVRLIDHDKSCISCKHGEDGNWTRQRHACHRYSVGSNATLRYNLVNIHGGCSICNNWKSGNEREYDKGLIKRYGLEYLEMIKSLPSMFPAIHLSVSDLKEKIQIARNIKAEILSGVDYSREEINNLIGIYK